MKNIYKVWVELEISISDLITQKEQLISGISEKFHISLDGAKEFLKLAIVDWVKTDYNIQISGNMLRGAPRLIQKLKQEVESWGTDDFDDDDFQVIGYCKNIR